MDFPVFGLKFGYKAFIQLFKKVFKNFLKNNFLLILMGILKSLTFLNINEI